MLCFLLLVAATSAASQPPVAAPVPVVTADHVGLHVANPDVSAEFHQRVLGLQPMAQAISPTMWWLRAGKVEMHLIGGRTTEVGTATSTHIAFRVPSVARQVQILDRNHVAWANASGAPNQVTTRADGVLQIYFRDPDGYRIEVNRAAK